MFFIYLFQPNSNRKNTYLHNNSVINYIDMTWVKTHVNRVPMRVTVVLARKFKHGIGRLSRDHFYLQIDFGYFGVGRHVGYESIRVGGLVEFQQPFVRRHLVGPFDPIDHHRRTQVGVLSIKPAKQDVWIK